MLYRKAGDRVAAGGSLLSHGECCLEARRVVVLGRRFKEVLRAMYRELHAGGSSS